MTDGQQPQEKSPAILTTQPIIPDVAVTAHPSGWIGMKGLRSKGRARKAGSSSSQVIIDQPDIRYTDGEDSKDAANVNEAVGETLEEVRSDDDLLSGDEEDWRGQNEGGSELRDRSRENGHAPDEDTIVYKVYKRRWFGLVQLACMNIIVSWDWITFAAISTSSAEYFNVTENAINWLSTGFLFAFVFAAPLVVYIIHRGGPRPAIIIASVLLLVGNWIRYGGTRGHNFGAVMFGQILTGLAQPFVLAAPTRYSDLWFTGAGRVAATAIMSLANPFGGALGQLIDPFWVNTPSDIPNMVLYVSIISSVATIPSLFIPSAPPTPATASSKTTKQPIRPSLQWLLRSPEFHLIWIPYSILVGLFNCISSLINQILSPYSFSETEAGIAGAILIVVGLVAAAITSPFIDRSKAYLLSIKIQVPIVALMYLAFIWAPASGIVAVYMILAILGAASFALVPIVLEFMCEITHPISPEITSTICWTGGQLLGGVFIVLSGPLTDGPNGGVGGDKPYNMQRVLWFQAAIALAVVPLPLCLGLFGRRKFVVMQRVEADKAAAAAAAAANAVENEGQLAV